MAEVIALASSVAGLVSLTMQISEVGMKYFSSIRHAKEQTQDLLRQLTALENVLRDLQTNLVTIPDLTFAFQERSSSVLARLAANTKDDSHYTGQMTVTELCRKDLDALKAKLLKREGDGWLKSAAKPWVWALTRDETMKAVTKLHQYREIFETSISIDSLRLSAITLNEVRSLKKEQNERYLTEIDNKILNWLSNLDFQNKHAYPALDPKINMVVPHWVLDSPILNRWKLGSPGSEDIICCLGGPGVGKTVLTSLYIDHIWEWGKNADIGVAYVYCDWNDQVNQTAANILGCITKQLLQQCHKIPDSIRSAFKAADRIMTAPPSMEEQSQLLREVVHLLTQCYVFIDALDELESTHQQHRQQLLKAVRDLRSESIRWFVTSRPFAEDARDMKLTFASAAKISVLADQDDLKSFLKRKIEDSDGLSDLIDGDVDFQNDIIQGMVERAGGQFLLPALNIMQLNGTTRRSEIRACLKNMTKTLRENYDQALERIMRQTDERKNVALHALLWIAYAKRPLKAGELLEALAVEKDKHFLDKDNMVSSRLMLEVCSGLVRIERDSDIVRLNHMTIQEYLVDPEAGFKKGEVAELFRQSAVEISHTLLTYMNFETFKQGPCPDDNSLNTRLTENKLAVYAASFCGQHLRGDAETVLLSPAIRFLQDQACVQALIQIGQTAKESRVAYSHRYEKAINGLWLAAWLGLARCCDVLLDLDSDSGLNMTDREMDVRSDNGRTPLHQAARQGNDAVVKLLLKRGARIDEGRKPPRSRMPRAAFHTTTIGWEAWQTYVEDDRAVEEVGLQLCTTGANAQAQNVDGRSLVHIAVQRDHKQLLQKLVRLGAPVNNVDRGDSYLWTSLQHACGKKDETSVETMQILLEGGADPDIQCAPLRRTALHHAAACGDREKVSVLLWYDVDSRLLDRENMTARDIALRNGHLEIAELIMNREKTGSNETALFLAAERGHTAVVKTLLNAGANPDLRTMDGETAMHAAARARHGDDDIVRLLHNSNAHLDTMNCRRETPLIAAVKEGNNATLAALLDLGADPNLQDDEGKTAMHWASGGWWTAGLDYGKAIDILARSGAHLDDVNSSGETPLIMAAAAGNVTTVRVLLARSAKVDIEGADVVKNEQGPVHAATSNGHTEVVALLTRHMSKLSAPDTKGNYLL